MRIKGLRMLPLMMLFGVSFAMAQVNFTQTTTSDFMQGTGLNVNIANDCVSLQGKMASLADWGATTNMPQTLKNHQIALWHDYIYLVGGNSGSAAVNTVYRATQQSLGISSWTTLSNLPVALQDMAVVATQTRLYVLGGRNGTGVSDKIYSAKLNNDGSIGSWILSETTLPQPCWGGRAVMVMGNIYMIGGAATGNTNDASDKVYRLTLDAWGEIASISEVTALPAARNGHAVATYDSKIFVTGGYDATYTAQNTVFAATVNLDGSLGSWTASSLPAAVYDHGLACSNGVLVVIGGYDSSLSLPSNKCFYAYLDDPTFQWTQSDIVLPERYTQGTAFAFGDKMFYCGGQTISNALNSYVRFMVVTTSDQMVKKASFVGLPFDVGAPKTMQQLNYTLNYTSSTTSYEILYRLASPDKVFGNWISAGSNLPAVINQDYSYIQYMFRFTANGSDNLSLEDVTLTLSGLSQLAGNLNDITTLSLEGSPYLVTGDISFTSGSHTIEAGVVIEFMPNTGMNIGQASMNFAGTEENPILLTSNGGETGMWNGVYFQDASDNGVTSSMNYTTIEKAGNGDNNANLRLYNTNQPVMNNCAFNNASGHGIRLVNSNPVITDCNISDNSESGLYLDNSAPSCTTCNVEDNLYGVYYATTNFNAVFSNVTLTGNVYGMYSCTPNRSFAMVEGSLSFVDNDSDVAVGGGQVSSDQTWNYFANGYALLGTVQIYGGTPKLTIVPGNTIKVKSGYYIYVGNGSSQGGMLYAVGTADAPITFTAYNGNSGGWAGLSFRDGSDYNSSSSLRYCVIEKAVNNITCASTNQPSIMWSTIQDAQNVNVELSSSNVNIEECTISNASIGIKITNSQPTLVSDIIENMADACIWHNDNNFDPVFFNCILKDSYFGIHYSTPNRTINNDNNVVFQNNDYNKAVPGGTISTNIEWASNTYAVLGSLLVGIGGQNYSGSDYSRLTIAAGSTLSFEAGSNIQISKYYTVSYNYSTSYYRWYGELYAIGTEDAPITFTSMNGEIGGWNGIYFTDLSDNIAGMESLLSYCIIEKGNDYNLYVTATQQPNQINHCIIRDAVNRGAVFESTSPTIVGCQFLNNGGDGIYSSNSLIELHNVQIENNGGYGMYYNNAYYMHILDNVSIEGNTTGQVSIGGGTLSEDRTWNAYTYDIMGSINVWKGGENYTGLPCRLTISPGSVLRFTNGAYMQISNYDRQYYSSNYHYFYYFGELMAIGTETAPITFTSMNGVSGGWEGLYFHECSDDREGMESVLNYCIIEKGNGYNLHINNTNQPAQINHCVFRDAVNKGININSSSLIMNNCQFLNNGGNGMHLDGGSPQLLNGQVMNNLGNGIYSSNSLIELHNVQINNNTGYGLYYSDAHYMHILDNVAIESNGIGQVALGGGNVRDDRTWNAYTYDILGSINVWKGGENYTGLPCRLTISPGSVLRFNNGANMQISNYDRQYYSSNYHYFYYYGELQAIGTEEDPITFTSMNGLSGGWGGLYFHDYSDNQAGMASLLKNCIIEKGNDYNIYINSSNQPSLIESCVIQEAANQGVYFSSSSSTIVNCQIINNDGDGIYFNGGGTPTIQSCQLQNNGNYGLRLHNTNSIVKNTIVRDNASYGLYIEGNSNPVVGGNYTNGCSIYHNNGGNGGYEVYQNGSANVNMPYNFFGSIDSVYIDRELVFDKIENSSKGRIDIKPNSWLPIGEDEFNWSGHLYYNGNTSKPLANRTIVIKDFQNDTLYQATTNSNGYYSFSNLDINVASRCELGNISVNHVNSTDALLVMRHFTQLQLLEGAQLRAADVNSSCTVNGTDALLIQRRYLGSIPTFPAGNVQIIDDAFSYSGNDLESDLNVLLFGDVNGDFYLSRDGIQLLLEGKIMAESHQQLVLPVTVKNFNELGAVSLRFSYPAEYLEIEGVTMPASGDNLIYQVEEGTLNISWYNLNPLMLENGDLLLNITIRTKNLNMLEAPIVFGLEADSELADGQGIAINGAIIAMPSVITETLGIDDTITESAFAVTVYPNPMSDKAKIAYCLPTEGSVTLTVYNTMGNVVATLADGQQARGLHQVELDSSQWASGVYYCRLTFGDNVRVIKLVVE